MVEKIYDKVGSVQEINGIAADLRRIGLIEEIKILAEKNNIPTDDVKAVSYTHLDVYKRQSVLCTLDCRLSGTLCCKYIIKCYW